MTFAALHFPADKDHQSQLPSFWPDNDNELGITGENFFDQFVTFDPGETAAVITSGEAPDDDPPSPSILLDSLGHELSARSPSDLLDLPPPPPLDETSATNTSRRHVAAAAAAILPQSSLAAAQQVDRTVFAPSAARDLVLGNGSISDSELLHLEGISLRSSPPPRRTIVTAPSSPPPPSAASSSTPHQPRGLRSSSKHSNRFIEAGYATIRRAAHRLRFLPNQIQAHYQPLNMADREGDTFLADARPEPPEVFTNETYEEFGDLTAEAGIKREEAVDSNGLPLSPPLTGRIPDGYLTGPSAFVTGHLDDPFCDDMSGATTVNRRRDIDTPISTPVIKDEAAPHSHNQVIAPASMSPFRHHSHKPYRSTSAAEWPTEGLLTDVKFDGEDVTMWNPSSPSLALAYVVAEETTTSADWWQAENSSAYHHHRGGVRNNSAAHTSISMHSQHHHQQQCGDVPCEYNASVSGLMIQMPQPRPPQANGILAAPGTPSTAYRVHNNSNNAPALSRSHAHHYQQQQNQGQSHHHSKGGHTDRRPRPRAPSSGARHHGAQGSPRKLHHSMSLGYLREEAQHQAPSTPISSSRHSHHQERRHQRSSSLTMRKQRSFTRRPNGSESRRTASTSTAGSCDGAAIEDHNNTATATNIGTGVGTSGSSSSAAVFSRGFVNYTPNDKNKLMAGVAPSGSSKTKLRREREALEKSRLISEMALKVAGGDVNPGVLKELMGNFSP